MSFIADQIGCGRHGEKEEGIFGEDTGPGGWGKPDGADGHIIDNDQKQGCCKAGQRVDYADLDLAQNRYCAF